MLLLPQAQSQWLQDIAHDTLFMGALVCCAFTVPFSMALKLPVLAISLFHAVFWGQQMSLGYDEACVLGKLHRRYLALKEGYEERNPVYTGAVSVYNQYVQGWGADYIFKHELNYTHNIKNAFHERLTESVLLNRTLCNARALTSSSAHGVSLLLLRLLSSNPETRERDMPWLQDTFYWISGMSRVWAADSEQQHIDRLVRHVTTDMKSLQVAYHTILSQWNQVNGSIQELKPTIAHVYRHLAAARDFKPPPDIFSVADRHIADRLNKKDAQLAALARLDRGFFVRYMVDLPFPGAWDIPAQWIQNADAFVEAIDYDTLIPSILSANIHTLFRMAPAQFSENILMHLQGDAYSQLYLALYAGLNPMFWHAVNAFVNKHVIQGLQHKAKTADLIQKQNLDFLRGNSPHPMFKMIAAATCIAPSTVTEMLRKWIPAIEEIFMKQSPPEDLDGYFDMMCSQVKYHVSTESKIIDFIQKDLIQEKLASYEFSRDGKTLRAPMRDITEQIAFLMRQFPDLVLASAAVAAQQQTLERRGATYWILHFFPYMRRANNSIDIKEYISVLLPWSRQPIYETVWSWNWLRRAQNILQKFYLANRSSFMSRFVYALAESIFWTAEEHDDESLTTMLQIAHELRQAADSKYDMERDLEKALDFFAERVAKPYLDSSAQSQSTQSEMRKVLALIQNFEAPIHNQKIKIKAFASVQPTHYANLMNSF